MAESLTVLSGLAVQGAVEQFIRPAFEKDTGIRLDVRWEPTTLIMKAMAAGEKADVVIVSDEAATELAQQGKTLADAQAKLALAVLGVAVKSGAKKPDVSTTDAFRKALLDARSVAYSRAGASGIHFEKLIERLGIAEPVRAKATVIPSGMTAAQLVNGKADLAVQQISELLTIDGIEVVGPYPPELQFATGFTAAIVKGSEKVDSAEKLLKALASAEALKAYRETGLELR
ncbi:MAG: extracellular solute-binding protein [Variibacter sp.]